MSNYLEDAEEHVEDGIEYYKEHVKKDDKKEE